MENMTDIAIPHEAHGELRRALLVLAGKWKLEILWLLHHRTHRFGELKRAIPGISQHMLTLQLRELERSGLVTRTIYAEVPPRVEYTMTATAKALEPTIHALLAWWNEHGRTAGERSDA
jgi:DNA-binding HxlR family transcriptional regulator